MRFRDMPLLLLLAVVIVFAVRRQSEASARTPGAFFAPYSPAASPFGESAKRNQATSQEQLKPSIDLTQFFTGGTPLFREQFHKLNDGRKLAYDPSYKLIQDASNPNFNSEWQAVWEQKQKGATTIDYGFQKHLWLPDHGSSIIGEGDNAGEALYSWLLAKYPQNFKK